MVFIRGYIMLTPLEEVFQRKSLTLFFKMYFQEMETAAKKMDSLGTYFSGCQQRCFLFGRSESLFGGARGLNFLFLLFQPKEESPGTSC